MPTRAPNRSLHLAVLLLVASLLVMVAPAASLAASEDGTVEETGVTEETGSDATAGDGSDAPPDEGSDAPPDEGSDAPPDARSDGTTGDGSDDTTGDQSDGTTGSDADGTGDTSSNGAREGDDGAVTSDGDEATESSSPDTDSGGDSTTPRTSESAPVTDDRSGDDLAWVRERGRARAAAARAAARARGAAVRRSVRERTQRIADDARAAARSNLAGQGDASGRGAGSRARPRAGATRLSIANHGERIELLPGRRDILINRRALVRGYIPSGRANEKVVLEVYSGGSWRIVDTAYTIDGGKFYLAWYPRRPGYFRVRARQVRNDGSTLPSLRRLLYIYRTAMASWYGPGFYGNTTACGQRFSRDLHGVAHKSLPCGKRLTVRYRGRAITVTVVDRGPYVHGRDYDLTEATRNYLGFDGVDEIWATA
ncbi:MAG TPA: RlpA-like double-psi beta-barrel domain-containing protein [Thermoleophilaceae bacterium]|nr:RlpA-like double-psi beta-barrel domain-containing protein [Thermoleophilaceae bacterium]